MDWWIEWLEGGICHYGADSIRMKGCFKHLDRGLEKFRGRKRFEVVFSVVRCISWQLLKLELHVRVSLLSRVYLKVAVQTMEALCLCCHQTRS